MTGIIDYSIDTLYHNSHLPYHETNLMATLENGGLRATARRKAIAKLLEKMYEGITTETLSEEPPSVGRATEYRTIKFLLNAGVVCKVSKMDGERVNIFTRVGHRYNHSVCVQCGAVGEFKTATIDRSLRAFASDLPGQIVDHRIKLYVTCDYCRADGGK